MNVVEQAREYQKLWQTMIHLGSPPLEQFVIWASLHTERHITRGISRTAAKARTMAQTHTPMTVDDAAMYASSVMKHERLGNRCHTPRSTTTGTQAYA